MSRLFTCGLAALLLVTSTAAPAASPLDGTWRGDVKSAKLPDKPDA